MATPLLVVTGFLGSGKTTLINALLRLRAARGADARGRIGLLVNELGAVDIDGALLGGAAARAGALAQQVELPGGCVCCVLGDELGAAVTAMVERNPELDAIVLETTGVAEPLPIQWKLQEPALAARVRLAAVITVVDAVGFLEARAVSPAVDSQVAEADVLMLGKGELVDDAQRAAVKAAAGALAGDVVWIEGDVAARAAWLEQVLAEPAEMVREEKIGHGHKHGHEEDDGHGHGHGIDSVWVAASATYDLEELEDRLAALPASYVRIKGIVRGEDGRSGQPIRGWFAVHRVGRRMSSERLADDVITGAGRMVALGSAVDAAALTAALADAALPEHAS